MREYLYRGGHPCANGTKTITIDGKKIKGEWVEGFYGKSGDKTFIIIDNDIAVGYFKMREVLPETVGQYTGLTDKNGKKIFEGDIVKYKANATYLGRFFECIGKVKYNEKSAFYALDVKYAKNHDYFPLRCEVIGNIYDNPELLEDRK